MEAVAHPSSPLAEVATSKRHAPACDCILPDVLPGNVVFLHRIPLVDKKALLTDKLDEKLEHLLPWQVFGMLLPAPPQLGVLRNELQSIVH